MELSDNTDHTGERDLFEKLLYQSDAKYSEILHYLKDPQTRHRSLGTAFQVTAITHGDNIQAAHTLGYQPLLFKYWNVTHVTGNISETHLSH